MVVSGLVTTRTDPYIQQQMLLVDLFQPVDRLADFGQFFPFPLAPLPFGRLGTFVRFEDSES